MSTTTKHINEKLNLEGIFPVVVLYGALWGFTEATVGFLLHLIPRFIGLPPIAGLIMFPLGVCFMLAGVGKTGYPAAAFFIAAVAALIKASSVVMAPVTWLFVQNPSISILLEGSVVWLLAGLFGLGARPSTPLAQQPSTGRISAHRPSADRSPVLEPSPIPTFHLKGVKKLFTLAFSAALLWRVLFVLAHFLFGIRWGLPAHGMSAVIQFLVLDSLINGIVITLLLQAAIPLKLIAGTRNMVKPLPAAAVLMLALIAEHGLSLL